MSRIGPLRGRSISARSSALTPSPVVVLGQPLVLVAGELAAGEAEPPAAHQALRIGGAGLVERPAHRRPPVDDDRVAGRVADVPAADVEGLGAPRRAVSVRPKNGGHVRVGGQRAQPLGTGGAEPLGGPGVDAGVGHGCGGGAHLGQAVGRARQVGALGGEHGIGGGGRLAEGRGHGRRTLPEEAAGVSRRTGGRRLP